MIFKFEKEEDLMKALKYLYRHHFLGKGECEWVLDMFWSLVQWDVTKFQGAKESSSAASKLRSRIDAFMENYPAGNEKLDGKTVEELESSGWDIVQSLFRKNLPVYIEGFSFGNDLCFCTRYYVYTEKELGGLGKLCKHVRENQ